MNARATIRQFLQGSDHGFLFKLMALVLAMALVVLGAGVALADTVVNDVTAAAETVSIANGGSATVSYKILNENRNAGDTVNSCNPGDGSAALVTINAPEGVTATPASLSFTGCDTYKSVSFTSTRTGDHTVTVSVSDSGGGRYETSGATFVLAVAAPSCTAASVTTHPTAQSITYGADATFTAAGAGSPAPTVQWQSDAGGSWGNIDGATGATLTVVRPSVSQSGTQYRAVFTNSCDGTRTATTNAAALTVAQRAITVTATAESKDYGDADPALRHNLTTGSLVGDDALSGNLDRESGESVGTYAIRQNTLSAGPNYALTFVGATFTIGRRSVEVTADDTSKNYGDADPDLTYQITVGTLVGTDAFTGSLSREPGENVGVYDIQQGTLDLGTNYNLSFVGGDFTIDKRTLSVHADHQTKTYGDATPTLSWDLSGFVEGEDADNVTISGAASCALMANTPTDVGIHSDAIRCVPGTLSATNYDFAEGDRGNLTITQRAIEVTADPQSKVYGDSDPTLSYQVTAGSLVGTDSFTGSLSRAAAEDVGTYAIDRNTLSAGPNYNLSYVSGDLTITRKALAVDADSKSKTWGAADPIFTWTLRGFVLGDTADDVEITGEAACSIAATAGPRVGVYEDAITCAGGTLAAANYSFSTGRSGTLTITAAFRISGLYAPVDAIPTVNTVKGGSTVPLKFEAFAGTTEQKDTTIVRPLLTKQSTCGSGGSDSVEVTATGGTSLRFDTSGDQFVYNWQTPKTAGACYTVTVELADGTSTSALFKIK